MSKRLSAHQSSPMPWPGQTATITTGNTFSGTVFVDTSGRRFVRNPAVTPPHGRLIGARLTIATSAEFMFRGDVALRPSLPRAPVFFFTGKVRVAGSSFERTYAAAEFGPSLPLNYGNSDPICPIAGRRLSRSPPVLTFDIAVDDLPDPEGELDLIFQTSYRLISGVMPLNFEAALVHGTSTAQLDRIYEVAGAPPVMAASA